MTFCYPWTQFPIVLLLCSSLAVCPVALRGQSPAQESADGIRQVRLSADDQDNGSMFAAAAVSAEEDLQTVSLPRIVDGRDRLDSRFQLLVAGEPRGATRYPGNLQLHSASTEAFPESAGKKGLQVQMLDDAIALKIRHATLNVNLAGLVDVHQSPSSLPFISHGRPFHFHAGAVRSLDQQVRTLSDAGVHVYLILLNYVHGDPAVDAVMRHPKSPAEPETVIEQYHRMLRVTHASVRQASSSARVYVSLDHFWTGRIGDDPLQAFGARELLDELAALCLAGGNFDWHVAHHPYPENLFEPRAWLDRTATDSPETLRITFRNLRQLTDYLNRPALLDEGQPRRVILSEQGFHSPAGSDGQRQQAAGFCYAWMRVAQLSGIDAFILHRHVDHAHEGGLNLELWTRRANSVATPAEPKLMYHVFRAADTPEWEMAFDFALAEIGIQSWSEITSD